MGKRTPVYPAYAAWGARVIEFGGWDMPVQFSGILEEHRAVRERAGLFDVSHMGEIEIRGPGSSELIQRLVTGDVRGLSPGRAMYTLMCRPDGGTLDDLLVYRLDGEHFLLVVNAATAAKDLAWILEHRTVSASVRDCTGDTGLLALQGPAASSILEPLTEVPLRSLKPFHFARGRVAGIEVWISRTGYTGEDGFELFVGASGALNLWNRLLEAGRPAGLVPAGLGARDTLRLEAGLPLYGHELTEEITPLEAGLERFVKWESGDFIGKEALMAQREKGLARRLAAFVMEDRGVPRAGYPVLFEGRTVGWVTSGTFGPTVGRNIGFALVEADRATEGSELEILIRHRALKATVVPRPFYRRPAAEVERRGDKT
ncbi:MAG: glycine cleavage system aminomethyltransferase GcvT [Alicyclobacillaceae bacterium]|nr:glycine cleavage system aminomethyltransferase GcvT [Alicyclobacillaceae bacterium]